MSRNGNYTPAVKLLLDLLIDTTLVGKWAKSVVNWLTKILNGKTLYKFEHNHNVIRSNVDKETLLGTRSGFPENVTSIWVRYADGFVKHFDETIWIIHGNAILKNCAKIKVILVYGKGKC